MSGCMHRSSLVPCIDDRPGCHVRPCERVLLGAGETRGDRIGSVGL
jgi:hypothetical protein